MMRRRPVFLFLLLAVNLLTGNKLVPVILTTKLMMRSRKSEVFLLYNMKTVKKI